LEKGTNFTILQKMSLEDSMRGDQSHIGQISPAQACSGAMEQAFSGSIGEIEDRFDRNGNVPT
jgi:hypothetical protein